MHPQAQGGPPWKPLNVTEASFIKIVVIITSTRVRTSAWKVKLKRAERMPRFKVQELATSKVYLKPQRVNRSVISFYSARRSQSRATLPWWKRQQCKYKHDHKRNEHNYYLYLCPTKHHRYTTMSANKREIIGNCIYPYAWSNSSCYRAHPSPGHSPGIFWLGVLFPIPGTDLDIDWK